MTGIEAFITMLADAGVRHIFGNPGTSELPLNDALLRQSAIQYILGLQEVPVMAIADGYAMAGGRLGVTNLHISCGLGSAMGMLYNAYREGTPLLVTAGQQDRRLQFEEPILWGDMVSVARPWTKWAVEVQRAREIPSAVRRAIQAALTPPTGPVFLSLPMDVQTETADFDLRPAALPGRGVRPADGALRRAVEVLLVARCPAILAGSRVVEAGAVRQLVAVAERLGAPVISESGTTHGRLSFPCDHRLYAGGLPLWSPEIRQRLDRYDVLLVAGMDLLRQYVYHQPDCAIPEHIRLVHLDEDPYQLGKNYPLEVGLIGDTKAGLAELDRLLGGAMTEKQTAAAQQRGDLLAEERLRSIEACRAAIEQQRDQRPITPSVLMDCVAKVLPDNVAVVEEAVTTTNTLLERLGALKNTDGYFGHRGWALGWGLGCAIGVQLAWPDRPVLALLGEGSAMYGIQGLWTAARYKIPVTFVICNNAQYQILKVGARGLRLPEAMAGRYLALDLTDPEIDFVRLAESLGVAACRVTEPEDVRAAIADGLAADRPRLIDVPISRETPARLAYG